MDAAQSTTSFRVESFAFHDREIARVAALDPRFRNWPAVYTLTDDKRVYVGESLNVANRLRQHRESPEKRGLKVARVLLDDSFNKSAALDLESYLIRLLAGAGELVVLNRNDGITDAQYFQRDTYRATFEQIFEQLRDTGVFKQSIREIENSDLFKLSPFKALTPDQASAVAEIVGALLTDLAAGADGTFVVQGDPGTGKTVVGTYLMKLLADLASAEEQELSDSESILSEFFLDARRGLLADLRIGLVVPQQSLRESIGHVFSRTPGLSKNMVMTPFTVGKSEEPFDLLIVDEAHRLTQRANQSAGPLNRSYTDINLKLYGDDDVHHTQLDWIVEQSRHQILLVDTRQTVRPADLPRETLEAVSNQAARNGRSFALKSQMRVAGGDDYVGYVRQVLSSDPPAERRTFKSYDLRLLDSLPAMQALLAEKEREQGLARLVAGFAWPWMSRANPAAFDIELDGVQLRWNTTAKDWVNSPTSQEEVGSIHTIQGYDLNYAGVIIGQDLSYDEDARELRFSRANYFDTKGKEGNRKLGLSYGDDALLEYVSNIYSVLLTRGIHGTFVYVVDPSLREYLRRYL